MKYPIRIHDPDLIHQTFATRYVLHNLLLEYDGMDNWEYQLHDNKHDTNAAYGTLETLTSRNVNRTRKNKLPIESGIKNFRAHI